MDHNVRCEVYNASYELLSTVTGRRALVLTLKGKATAISEHPTFTVNAGSTIFGIPTKIVLTSMVKARPIAHLPAQLSQQNLFTRDDWTCQYCGRHRSELKAKEILTRDHIHPLSEGGRDEWLNVVTACNKCNHSKANRFLHTTDKRLRSQPYVPTIHELRCKKIKPN